jgi:Trk K+ transport system NAD-binding subunit
VTIVCHQPDSGRFTPADRDTVLGPNDLIVIAGQRDDVSSFAGEMS